MAEVLIVGVPAVIRGNKTFKDNVTIEGNFTVSGTTSTAVDLVVSGDVTLGDDTSDAININGTIQEFIATQISTSGIGFQFTRDLAAASTDSPVLKIVQDNAGDDQAALEVQGDGTGLTMAIYEGTVPTWGHSPKFAVEGQAEFDAKVWLDGDVTQSSSSATIVFEAIDVSFLRGLYVGEDRGLSVGNSKDAWFEWDTTETNRALKLGLSGSNNWLVGDKADINNNNRLANSTDPTLWMQDATGLVVGSATGTHDGADLDRLTETGVFGSAAVGDRLYVVSGTGVTAGWYTVMAVDAATNYIDVDPDFVSGGAGSNVVYALFHNVMRVDAQGIMAEQITGFPGGDIVLSPGANVTLAAAKHLVLPQHNDATTPTLGFGDGDTGFYESADDNIKITIAGNAMWVFDGTAIASVSSYNGPYLPLADATATVPVYAFTNDNNSGIGLAAADQLSLIAGGIEGIRVNTAATGVNYLNITPSAAGADVLIATAGTDTNIDLAINAKGAGDIILGGQRTTVTVGGGTNDDGLTFGSLGTATKGIDLSGSGLSGATDYPIYIDANNYWRADGLLNVEKIYSITGGIYTNKIFAYSGGAPITIDVGSLTPFLLGNAAAIGSLTSCTSNATATITKTAHGLSVAAGDLVHITGATTAADRGFYRLVSSTANTLVVDRALTGSDADVALTVYKDVIGIFATNNVDGQRIMSYSHQDKPLQIGGDVLAATGHSLGAEDVLIGGKLEVDGTVYFDAGWVKTGGAVAQQDMYWYEGSNISMWWDINGASDQFAIQVSDLLGNQVIIGNQNSSFDQDFDHATQTNPTLFIHSDVAPNTDNTQWLSLAHDQTDAVIASGKGNIKLSPVAGSNVVVNVGNIGLNTSATAPAANGFFGFENTYKRLQFHDGTEVRYVDPRDGSVVNQDRLQICHVTTHIGTVGAGAAGNYAAFSAKETMRIQEVSVWARAETGTVDGTVSVYDDGATIQTSATTIAAAATMYTAALDSRLTTIAEGSVVSIYITTNAGDGSLTDLTVDIAYYAS